MKELILLHGADADVQAAFNRYEEYQTARGEIFIRHLDIALGLIRQNPEIGPDYKMPYRRMLVTDFPFGIFYEVTPTRIVVAAILDLRQDPKSIRDCLSGRE